MGFAVFMLCVIDGKDGNASHDYDLQAFTSSVNSRRLYDYRVGRVVVENTVR